MRFLPDKLLARIAPASTTYLMERLPEIFALCSAFRLGFWCISIFDDRHTVWASVRGLHGRTLRRDRPSLGEEEGEVRHPPFPGQLAPPCCQQGEPTLQVLRCVQYRCNLQDRSDFSTPSSRPPEVPRLDRRRHQACPAEVLARRS